MDIIKIFLTKFHYKETTCVVFRSHLHILVHRHREKAQHSILELPTKISLNSGSNKTDISTSKLKNFDAKNIIKQALQLISKRLDLYL